MELDFNWKFDTSLERKQINDEVSVVYNVLDKLMSWNIDN